MKEELVDVYDKNRNVTGKVINRRDISVLTNDEYIITVHCFIINVSNQILLTQRSFNKNRGGEWEETHGGLRAGEKSIDGIRRELQEEIGVDVQNDELKLIKILKKKNKFRDIYILRKNIPLYSLKYNDGEVINCKYVSLNEFKSMIENDECTFEKFEETIFYNNDIEEL